jgi:hypothetical protein
VSKFAATSAADLRTEARNSGRLTRKVEYVVTVEVDDGSWCELDATDEAHAKTLAHNWVDKLGARGCSCWRVRLIDGRLTPNPIYTYYWTGDEPAQLENLSYV